MVPRRFRGPAPFADHWTRVREAKLYSVEAAFPGRIPFVLLPGLAMSGAYFLPLARLLAEEHPVRILELPGFGRSSGPPKALSMCEHAEWLNEWMQARAISACHLVGHSMGCQVAAHLAAAHPDRVRTLTLIGPTVDMRARQRLRQIFRLARDLIKERPPVLFRALSDVLRAGIVRTWRTSTEMLADRLEVQLARITAPTLLLRGARDSIAPESWLQAAAEVLVAGRWQTIPGGAHCVQFSDPGHTAAAIATFVGCAPFRG